MLVVLRDRNFAAAEATTVASPRAAIMPEPSRKSSANGVKRPPTGPRSPDGGELLEIETGEDEAAPFGSAQQVERMHLLATGLTPRGASQMGLFDDPPGRADALADVKRAINSKVGRFAVRSAATLPLAAIYHDPANSYDNCDVRGKVCF
jgi:hypothetical protein